ncbi:MAG TPA: tetratricopeptide repeat protein [Thermoanaerobaculia bacterium]
MVKVAFLAVALSALLLPANAGGAPVSAGPTPAATPGDGLREARKNFLKARSAVSDGRFREALELYRHVIEALPDDAVVRYEYAQLLRDLNVPDEATRQAREAVRLDPSLPEAHRLLGNLELAAAEKDPARLDRAVAELRKAHELVPYDASATASLARALLTHGQAAEAAKLLDDVPESRTQPALMRLAAEARARSGRTRDAEELYSALREADPNDREVTAALIDLYEEEDRLDEALQLLHEMETKDPENAAVSERITIDLARAGRFDEAEKRARELAAGRPENRAVRRLLAQVLFEKGDAKSAEKILRDLVTSDPEDEQTRRALIDVLIRDRKFDEARPLLEESRKRTAADPKTRAEAWPTVEAGYIAFLQRNYSESKRVLEPVALTSSGGTARATRILLGIAREEEDASTGLARAQTAAAAEPDNPEWTTAVAEFQIRSGDKKTGEDALNKLAASDDLERILGSADAYARLKDFNSAIRISRRAAARFPDSTEALFRLGSSLERGGQVAESEKVFLQILNRKPNDAATQNYLGYMWADRNVNLDRAKELLEKAVAREPRNGAFQDSLGWAYFRLGRLDDAEQRLILARRTDPDDATIEEHMGDILEKKGNAAQAIVHWERALTLKPDEPDKLRQKLARAKK